MGVPSTKIKKGRSATMDTNNHYDMGVPSTKKKKGRSATMDTNNHYDMGVPSTKKKTKQPKKGGRSTSARSAGGSAPANTYDHIAPVMGGTGNLGEPQLYNTLSRRSENNVYDVGVRSKKKDANVNANADSGGFGGEYATIAPPPANNIYDAGVRVAKSVTKAAVHNFDNGSSG